MYTTRGKLTNFLIERASDTGNVTRPQNVRRSNSQPDATGAILASRNAMQTSEPARYTAPFFLQVKTGDDLADALRLAVRQNEVSMNDLHEAITRCIVSLRDEGMQCEAALLTMKACVRHCARNHQKSGEHSGEYSDILMEQITRWCIADFFFVPE